MDRRFVGWIALLAPLAVVSGFAADDAAPVAQSGARRGAFSWDLTLEQRYDDNILQLSPGELAALENNPRPGRFLIETPDDFVTVGRIRGRWRFRPLARRETRVSVEVDRHQYARNGVKSHSELGVALRQELTASRRGLAILRVEASYTPDFYLRQLTDDDASFAASRRIRRAAKFRQQRYELGLDKELAGDAIGLSLGVEWRIRDYNEQFDERDGTRTTGFLGVTARPFAASRFQIGARYAAGRLDARGDLASTMIADDDVSYDHRALEGFCAIPWGRRLRGRLELDLGHERRKYTTENRFDLSRHGRIGDRREIGLRVTQRIASELDLVAWWTRVDYDSSFPAGVLAEEGTADYVQNRYALAESWR